MFVPNDVLNTGSFIRLRNIYIYTYITHIICVYICTYISKRDVECHNHEEEKDVEMRHNRDKYLNISYAHNMTKN